MKQPPVGPSARRIAARTTPRALRTADVLFAEYIELLRADDHVTWSGRFPPVWAGVGLRGRAAGMAGSPPALMVCGPGTVCLGTAFEPRAGCQESIQLGGSLPHPIG
jgi:hypothetical protein